MASDLGGRNFVSMVDFSAAQLREVLDVAARLKAEQLGGAARPLLAGKTLGMIFQKPSLRTRVSFEVGMTQLGGHAIYLAPSDISLGKRETTEDIARVLSRYCDVLMARVFGHDIVTDLAQHATVPVINGLSAHEHPCQIVADLLTIEEHKGSAAGRHLVYAGDGNNVAHSLMLGGALVGMHVTIATPPGYEPDPAVLAAAQEIGAGRSARITAVHDLRAAARGADVIYTDVWASMGQEQEAAERAKVFAPYQVNADVLAVADPQAIIMHCLPAHYGDEITYDVTRTPNSVIFDQAENRLHGQKAVLALLAG